MATQPGADFIGVEVHTPGLGAMLMHIGERRLEHVRLIQHDTVDLLNHLAPGAYRRCATDGRPLAKFEQRGLQAFQGVWNLVLGRCEGARGQVGVA